MKNYYYLFKDWYYVLILIFIMVISGIIKQNGYLIPIYNFFIKYTKNKKILIVLLSMIGGILPIPGRVIVSAGLLDTIAPLDVKKRSKFGIIDYLATHHYYLWSPLEATILLPIATLGLSYFQVLTYTFPLLIISILFLIFYIWQINSTDIEFKKIEKIDSNYKKWYEFINWKTILFIFFIIVFSNYIKSYNKNIMKFIENYIFVNNSLSIITFLIITILGFFASFLMGSSSKFIGITVLLTSIFGLPYFTYFFTIEYIGYLLSPFHKCLLIGASYFKTPIKKYYFILGIWCVLLFFTGIIFTFLKLFLFK